MNKNRKIIIWLSLCSFMIVCMIAIGGITRLTHSGLSITEWNPVRGTIPPLNSNEWQVEFQKYQATPEFIKINFDMNILEFKKIYLVEYFHRLFGRLIGVVFIVPFLYFMIRGYFNRKMKKFLLGIFVLGGTQGFIGWYMVKSGLTDMPNVSHFKLAFHLDAALLILGLILWKIFSLNKSNKHIFCKKNIYLNMLLVIIQITYGAFVAGLGAGKIYNTFPLMAGSFIPSEMDISNISLFLNDPAIVQFTHRVLAYLIVINYIYLAIKALIFNKKDFLITTLPLGIIIILQVFIGILTVVFSVPLLVALLHQFIAVVLFAFSLYYIYLCSNNNLYNKTQ